MAELTPEQQALVDAAFGNESADPDKLADPPASAAKGASQFDNESRDWVDNIYQQVLREAKKNLKDSGYTPEVIENWFEARKGALYDHLNSWAQKIGEKRATNFPSSFSDMQMLEDSARRWFGARDNTGMISYAMGVGDDDAGGGGGGGGSTATLTPEQIRAQYDVDSLARDATRIYQGLLFDEPRDSRAIASAYIDAIIKNPDQKLDWQTFVKGRVQNEARYNLIYKNKPKGMTEEQYFAPYVNSATQMLAPREISSAVTGAAQLGASQGQFRERMARSDSATSSAPFITGFEKRMQDLAGVFKG